jgi:hypothetical protein
MGDAPSFLHSRSFGKNNASATHRETPQMHYMPVIKVSFMS